MAPCTVTVRRAPNNALAYARTAAGISNPILGSVPDGMGGYPALEAVKDSGGLVWIRLGFLGGSSGWVSGDRLDVQGSCWAEGFGSVSQPTQASTINFPVPLQINPPTPSPTPPPPPPPPHDTLERVRKASFNITAGFEGGAYNTYQNYDAGIVSFGRFGFTLASGSLFSVIDRYLSRSSTSAADQLRRVYWQRIRDRDPLLRNDTILRDLLIAAAAETVMHIVQDEIATELYWNLIQDLSVKPRGIGLALSQAFLFDTGVNHGAYHDMITSAETALGVPQRSHIPENGISEQQLIAKVAEIRRDRLYSIANSQNLPGLKPRGDFWVNICAAGDWNLQGDGNGEVLIKVGRLIQVRNP